MAKYGDVVKVGPNADLHAADLASADLHKADLSGADLTGANLNRANMLEAKLTGANLSGANLIGADLRGADLVGADLRGIDLHETDLRNVWHSERTRWPEGFDQESVAMRKIALPDADKPVSEKTEMLKLARSQARWTAGWGAINLIFAGLSNPFGAVLLIAGLATYYMASASMFLINGLIFLWAAVINLFVGGGLAYFFSVILAVSAFVLIRWYLRFRPVEAELRSDSASEANATGDLTSVFRAGRVLPWAASGLAVISLIGALLSFGGVIAFGITAGVESGGVFIFVFFFHLALQLGVLALSAGLASLLSGYRYKAISLLGAAGGTVSMVVYLIILLAG